MRKIESISQIATLKNNFTAEKSRLLTSTIAVFLLGLAAHAYGFLNLIISRASLCEFYASKGDMLHRIGLGRFMVPVYQLVFHGRVTLPWLNGLLALIWLSVSVWLISVIFSIRDKFRIFLIAGICTVNVTVTALTATCVHDLDADMFGVMLAVLTVFLWKKDRRVSLLGIPIIVIVLGLYQSILSVFIVLVMFISIVSLMNGEKSQKVILKGLRAICMILIAGVIYLIAAKLSCRFNGIELSSEYNGLTHLFNADGGLAAYPKLFFITYFQWLLEYFKSSRSETVMLALHVLLAIPTFVAVFNMMRSKVLPVSNKIVVIVLGIFIPLGMNISCLADGGMVHDYMFYSAWLLYLFTILMTDWLVSTSTEKTKIPTVCSIVTLSVILIILFVNIQTSNSAYIKKDLERHSTLAMMTRINDEMNRIEGYVPGETEVVFIGVPQTGVNDLFPNLIGIIGLESSSSIVATYSFEFTDAYDSYFKYFLQTPIVISKKDIPDDFVESMMSFPKEGSIQWYDNVLVVKLS